MNRKALGKGLNALIPEFEMGIPGKESLGAVEIPLHEIVPNPQQPRKHFDDTRLQELVQSIREKGVIQPIVVQKNDKGYEIIVGERRWRASQRAGLKKIPAVIKEATDTESLELAIIENIHRHDLNPIEEGQAYNRLAEDFGLKQEQIAKRVGKNRASISNYIRLLRLPRAVQEDIVSERLSMGHARALLGLASEKEIVKFRRKIIDQELNVRQIEEMVKDLTIRNGYQKGKTKTKSSDKNVLLKNLKSELERFLGTKVDITPEKMGGKLIIQYYSETDLERLRELLVSKIA